MNVYRYEEHKLSNGKMVLDLLKYEIIKLTPKGFWIEYKTGKKFIKDNATKKFACRTKQQAIISFVRRKMKQLEILRFQKNNALSALNLGLDMANEEYYIDIERYVSRNEHGHIIYEER